LDGRINISLNFILVPISPLQKGTIFFITGSAIFYLYSS